VGAALGGDSRLDLKKEEGERVREKGKEGGREGGGKGTHLGVAPVDVDHVSAYCYLAAGARSRRLYRRKGGREGAVRRGREGGREGGRDVPEQCWGE